VSDPGPVLSESERVLLTFARGGPGRYLSHLDTVRALQRTFARADLDLALSAGMRPKPRLAVGLPLPVGAAAIAELAVADVVVDCGEDDGCDGKENGARTGRWQASLRAAGPPGIEVLDVEPWSPGARLHPRLAIYRWSLDVPEDVVAAAVRSFLAESSVPIERNGPKGSRVVDLRTSIDAFEVRCTADGCELWFGVRHEAHGAARPSEVLDEVMRRSVIAGSDAGTAPDAGLIRCGVVYAGLAARGLAQEWLERHGSRTQQAG
jgi:hypothetical protein